ncbi:MAG: hypothetical protein J6S68_07030 [Acinetobacter sp.]|nr:hypothetical protein [Acinetobacter sp.]
MTDNSVENRNITAGRAKDGKFTHGNPGRVPGSRNRVSSATMQELKNLAPSALTVLKNGLERDDVKAATYVLDRILPNQRTVELENADVVSIINALTNGDVSPDEARLISQSIARLREVEELDRVKDRLAEVERLLKG